MVESLVHQGSSNVGKDIVAHKINRVFNHQQSKVEELVHSKSHNFVIVEKVCFAEIDVDVIHHWVQEPILVDVEISLEIDVKIFEDQLNFAVTWEYPSINFLVSVDLPVLDSGKVNLDKPEIIPSTQLNLNIPNIQIDH